MALSWEALKKELYPIKDYEDLARRWADARGYALMRHAYDFTLAELEAYTGRLLGEDTRGRYGDYVTYLDRGFQALGQAGVKGLWDLCARVETRAAFVAFVEANGLAANEVIGVLKYLVYWVIPAKKQARELVKNDPALIEMAALLRPLGIRYNLDLLERGRTPPARLALAEESGLPLEVIDGLVYRADFSRMPWTSSATIANIVGCGYASMAQVASAPYEQIRADFFRYGAAIGKNLKLGNEIDNSWRVSKILPKVIEA